MELRYLGLAAVIGLLTFGAVYSAVPAGKPDRGRLKKAFEARNFKDAYEGYRALAIDADDDRALVGDDLVHAVACLQRLGRVNEIDAFREAVIKAHAGNVRLAQAAAETLTSGEHHGFPRRRQVRAAGTTGAAASSSVPTTATAPALQVLVHVLGKVGDEPDRAPRRLVLPHPRRHPDGPPRRRRRLAAPGPH